MPINRTRAVPTVVVTFTARTMTPSAAAMRTCACALSPERWVKRRSSLSSRPNAFTTRTAPNTSWTTFIAPLSSSLANIGLAHAPVVSVSQHKHKRRDSQGNQRERQVDTSDHVHHGQEHQTSRTEGDEAIHD